MTREQPIRRTSDKTGARTGGKRGQGRHGGRDVAALLTDFGHDLPRVAAAAAPPVKEPRLFRHVPRHGAARRGRGWAPALAPVSAWRMTSDQAPVLWPFICAPGLPPTGAQMGIDQLSGGSFYADPIGWTTSEATPITNPNVWTFGKPGQGKSANTKAFIQRMMDFGYRALVLGDPKDEYEALCRANGVEPLVIGPGMGTRINPLAIGPLGRRWADLDPAEAQRRSAVLFARWLTLTRALVGSQRIGESKVAFGPTDEVVVKAALRNLTGYSLASSTLREITIPQLWHALDEPSAELITECRFDSRRDFWDQTRTLRDALGQLVSGALAGLFDDHTSLAVDWTAPIQSLSLSRLEALGDEPVGIALTCLNSWGRGMRELAAPGDLRVVVRDECWKQLRLGTEAVMSFDADMRLSRKSGDVQWAVGHKPGDTLCAGDAGSQAASIAKELLHLADTKILHGQDPAVATELEELLELGPIARDLVTGWARQGKGRAVWVVGEAMYKVQTVLHPIERRLTYTNQALETAGELGVGQGSLFDAAALGLEGSGPR